MIRLVGTTKLTKQLVRLGRFQPKVFAATKRKENLYRKTARDTVQRIVYSAKPNPDYPRSGNMLAATDVLNVKPNPDASATFIYLNPDRASRSFTYQYRGDIEPSGLLSYYSLVGKGGHRFYASYVKRGIFFNVKMDKRDFVAGWAEDITPIYVSDVSMAIRKF
jgi:hypothetical protein